MHAKGREIKVLARLMRSRNAARHVAAQLHLSLLESCVGVRSW